MFLLLNDILFVPGLTLYNTFFTFRNRNGRKQFSVYFKVKYPGEDGPSASFLESLLPSQRDLLITPWEILLEEMKIACKICIEVSNYIHDMTDLLSSSPR
jgi:hypothetical protein